MVKWSEFIKSAADQSGWIEDDIPEILFVGRSNVGKSSFINALTNNKKMAKISSTPGKTRLLNFFDINKHMFRIVDAPGYGYAKIPMTMKEAFGKMMDEYITNRPNLKLVAMLVDLRHAPTADDLNMYEFFKFHKVPVVMIGTKLDKLKQNEIKKNEKMVKEKIGFDEKTDAFFKVSNTARKNIESVYEEFIKRLDITE